MRQSAQQAREAIEKANGLAKETIGHKNDEALPKLRQALSILKAAHVGGDSSYELFVAWGLQLLRLHDLVSMAEAKQILQEATTRFIQAAELAEEASSERSKACGHLADTLFLRSISASGQEIAQLEADAEMLEKFMSRLPDDSTCFRNYARIMDQLARIANPSAIDREYIEKAVRAGRQVATALPGDSYAHWKLACSLTLYLQTAPREERETIFNETNGYFASAERLNPGDSSIQRNWAKLLAIYADYVDTGKKMEMLKDACSKCAKSEEYNSTEPELYYLWGDTLENMAAESPKEKAIPLFEEAIQKYDKSWGMGQSDHDMVYNWGNAYFRLGNLQTGPVAVECFEKAAEKYRQVAEADTTDFEALSSWGSALGQIAKVKDSVESDRLYSQAYAKYKKTMNMCPEYVDNYLNWLHDLWSQANRKEGAEAQAIRRKMQRIRSLKSMQSNKSD